MIVLPARRVLVALGAVGSLVAARFPEPGGDLIAFLPDTEEGRAIREELAARMTTETLFEADGDDPIVRIEPEESGTRKTWRIVPLRSSLDMDALAETLEAEGPDRLPGLSSITRDGETLVLGFDEPACSPASRLGRILLPARVVTAPFEESTSRPFRFDALSGAARAPYLESISLVLAAKPPEPGPDELSVREDGRVSAICVGYGLSVRNAPDGAVVRWLRETLAPEAFAPLVTRESTCGYEIELPARPGSALRAGTDPPESLRETLVVLSGTRGARSDEIRGRARALLTEHGLEVTIADVASAGTFAIDVDRVVAFGIDPAVDEELASRSKDRWTVLAIGFHTQRAVGVYGPIGTPGQMWIGSKPPSP